jgi:hypothetical protein
MNVLPAQFHLITVKVATIQIPAKNVSTIFTSPQQESVLPNLVVALANTASLFPTKKHTSVLTAAKDVRLAN